MQKLGRSCSLGTTSSSHLAHGKDLESWHTMLLFLSLLLLSLLLLLSKKLTVSSDSLEEAPILEEAPAFFGRRSSSRRIRSSSSAVVNMQSGKHQSAEAVFIG